MADERGSFVGMCASVPCPLYCCYSSKIRLRTFKMFPTSKYNTVSVLTFHRSRSGSRGRDHENGRGRMEGDDDEGGRGRRGSESD